MFLYLVVNDVTVLQRFCISSKMREKIGIIRDQCSPHIVVGAHFVIHYVHALCICCGNGNRLNENCHTNVKCYWLAQAQPSTAHKLLLDVSSTPLPIIKPNLQS